MSDGWSLAAVHDVLADAIGGRDMVVWGDQRRTYAQVADRSRRLATHLAGRGIGLRAERSDLARWECGQSPVAVVMDNRPEYLESMLACFRARTVPFNVNHHYRPAEVRALLQMVGAEAVVLQRRLSPLVAEAVEGLDLVLVDVDDGSGADPIEGAVDYERAIATTEAAPLPEPSGDDLYLVCTGGTTGSPKAVMWRQADAYVAAMGGSEDATAESIAAGAETGVGPWFTAAPLMHAAAQWTVFSGLHMGATVVLHDANNLDAAELLRVAERERVVLMSIVGDAFARPIIDALRRDRYDLSSLSTLATGGAVTSEGAKDALLELLPHLMIVEGYGASETGGMAFEARTRGAAPAGLSPGHGAVVLSGDRRRILEPGSSEVGWTARRGCVPLGYLGDRTATESTFPVIDGERFAVPGDRATVAPDGSINMLGRDSLVVNTGGEKVFVEEVEEALRGHPAVADALVVGRPSERFGQEVVAVVELRGDQEVSARDLRDHCAGAIARFKAPRAVAFVDRIQRHPSGKPDYRWARGAADGGQDATRVG